MGVEFMYLVIILIVEFSYAYTIFVCGLFIHMNALNSAVEKQSPRAKHYRAKAAAPTDVLHNF